MLLFSCLILAFNCSKLVWIPNQIIDKWFTVIGYTDKAEEEKAYYLALFTHKRAKK